MERFLTQITAANYVTCYAVAQVGPGVPPGSACDESRGKASRLAPIAPHAPHDKLMTIKFMKTTPHEARTAKGFAIPGTLLNITAGGLLLAATATVCLCNTHKLAAMASYPELSSQNQDATSFIINDIRKANSLQHASADRVVLKCGSPGNTTLITYTYDPAARTLTRTDGRSTQTVLTDLEGFSFSFFQRPSATAAFNSFAPATAATARMVSCHWSCTRKIAGAKVNSERVDLAPVVLRNHC